MNAPWTVNWTFGGAWWKIEGQAMTCASVQPYEKANNVNHYRLDISRIAWPSHVSFHAVLPYYRSYRPSA
jgi:hypothetical protein